MLEKLFKGTFVLTVWGFILIAVSALLPDSAWEKFPEPLLPIRDFLAEKNIISSEFKKENQMVVSSKETDAFVDQAISGSEGKNNRKDTAITPKREPLHSPSFTGMRAETIPPGAIVKTRAETKEIALPAFPEENMTQTSASTSSNNREIPGKDVAQDKEIKGKDVGFARSEPAPIQGTPIPIANATSTPVESGNTSLDLPRPEPISLPSPLANQNMPAGPEKIAGQISNDSMTEKSNSAVANTLNDVKSPFPSLGGASTIGAFSTGTSTKDTLPNLAFDTPAATQTNSSLNQTAVSGNNMPAVTAPGSTPAQLIGNATVPDQGAIQATSAAIKANPVTSMGTAPLPNATLPEAAANLAPQNLLDDAIQLAQLPDQQKTAFFKLNQIREQYGATFQPADFDRMNKALDRLAFTMFYDPSQHVLEPAYTTGPNETLLSIASQYKITPELLAALNSINQPVSTPLAPGTKLKVVRGPVSASVSISKKELLLQFDGLYAGRFKMGCAQTARTLRGILSVTQKIPNPQYIGPLDNGQWGEIAGGDPTNPLGPCWIELNNGLGLQGTNHPEYIGTETARQGGLIFSNKDIAHLSIILPPGANIHLND